MKWRIYYMKRLREYETGGHEDVEAGTPGDALALWLEVPASPWDGWERTPAGFDEEGPTSDWLRLDMTLRELNKLQFSIWAGDWLYTFAGIDPCVWALCPTCHGRGEIELPETPNQMRAKAGLRPL